MAWKQKGVQVTKEQTECQKTLAWQFISLRIISYKGKDKVPENALGGVKSYRYTCKCAQKQVSVGKVEDLVLVFSDIH